MVEGAATGRPSERARLTRAQVLRAALSYVDAHGLGALSMNKLGAELGVRGMSLYSHVASKDELLDGIVEAMWAELERPATVKMTWSEALHSYAHSLRDLIFRHVAAAPLLNRRAMPIKSLEHLDAYREVLVQGGLTGPQAIQALRVVHGYSLGFALVEASWWGDTGEPRRPDDLTTLRRVTELVPRDASDHLLRLAIDFCCGFDQIDQFQSGLDLMVQGLQTRLSSPSP